MAKRAQLDKWVYRFTEPTIMKFQPTEDYQLAVQQTKESLGARIRNFFYPNRLQKEKKGLQRQISFAQQKSSLRKKVNEKPKIKFVKKLTNQHVLVGNEDQIDAMGIGGVINEFVDTDFLWSLNIKTAIFALAVDYKNNYIIVLSESQVFVFKYQAKNLHEKPSVLFKIKLAQSARTVLVIKQGTFTLCFNKRIQNHSIDEVKGVRIISQKVYELPKPELKVFQIPQPYQNILNIFFQEGVQGNSIIGIWNIEFEFLEKEIKMGKASKVYDIPRSLRKTTRLQNFSKTILLVNLGELIYAIRKGYVIDNAKVDRKVGHNYLKYLSNNRLIHVSDTKVQVYRFIIDQELQPPRIRVQSTDSIEIPHLRPSFQYVEALEMLGDNIVVFYQTKTQQNKLLNGQTKYAFVVTQQIKMQEKIKNLLVGKLNIDQKADIANKMGMQRKEIFLRAWQNSNRQSADELKLLQGTLDYDTIKAEIEKKLKKNSMVFRQVLLLEQRCMSMLLRNVFSPQNKKEDIQNYLISHFLVRKLQLYRQISMDVNNRFESKKNDKQSDNNDHRLFINIQNYNHYKKVDLKGLLFQYIHRFCNEDKDQIIKIRIILKSFKFTLSVIYQELLREIINGTKKKFIKLLEAIPQILPFQPDYNEIQDQNKALYEGIWKEISDQQWEKGLYINTVSTIDNKQNLAQICSKVWCKRYWLTQHDFINMSRSQIQKLHDLNLSAFTFYEVIQKLFENIQQYAPLRQVIDFIQDNYQKLPQHIYGKIFLYRKLFDHFKENKQISKIDEIDSFANFLKLKDDDIFRAMFNYQKAKKGFILKEMKPLYQKLAGIEVFNEGLLNYFVSPKSQISDIKYLLNRMSNQKREFHQQNKGIYKVLIIGMQLKLKLGSTQEIPIDQVLIYIQNIPLQGNEEICNELSLMKIIRQQAARFRKIKLNMSIFDMTKNADNVIAAIIHYQIEQAKVKQLRDISSIKDFTYSIINDIQDFKSKLYPENQYVCLTLFTYLTQLLQVQELIAIVSILLEDEMINRKFPVSQILIENLVLYSYKWKLTHVPAYKESATYLRDLVNLLPADNDVRQFIQAQIEVAETLTSSMQVVCYPLSKESQYFTSRELQNIIFYSPGEHLLEIDVERLYFYALKVQELSSDGEFSEITLNGLYQSIILRLIQCNMLREVVPKIKSLIAFLGENPKNFIYVSLLVAKIAPQMIEQNRNLLLKCSSYLFKQPLKLLGLLQQMMGVRLGSGDFKKLILKYYIQVKHEGLIFSQNCELLEPFILKQIVKHQNLKKNLNYLLRYGLYNLLAHKQEFSKSSEHYIMYIILINEPKVLVKYFYYNRYNINIKHFRCFFSFLIKDDLFSKAKVLQFLKRLFIIIYESINKNRKIEDVIQQYYRIPLDQNLEYGKITNPLNQFEEKIAKSLERLKQKIKSVNNQIGKRKGKDQEYEANRLKKIKIRLQSPKSMEGIYQYPFADSDDNPRNQQQKLKKQNKLKYKIIQPFDSKYERQTLLKRSVKNIGLIVSVQKQKSQRALYYTQKFSKEGIYGTLTINKNIEKKLALSIENAIANSAKQSRASKQLQMEKVHSHYMNLNEMQFGNENLKISRPHAIQEINQQEKHLIKMEENQMIKAKMSAIDNIPQLALKLNSVVDKNMQITEETVFNFDSIDVFSDSDKFHILLREIISVIYARNDITFKGDLVFIKKLNQKYPTLKLNSEWIATYLRGQQLQKKYKLDLPLKKILTVDGLFVDSNIVENLFHKLLPDIIKNSTDQNILKICKVITLAFKKPKLQQEILFYYLLQLLNQYQSSMHNSNNTESDILMLKQKTNMIIQKIPTKYLCSKDETMLKIFSDNAVRREIASLLVQSFRNRKDLESADLIDQKYLSKVKRAKKAGDS